MTKRPRVSARKRVPMLSRLTAVLRGGRLAERLWIVAKVVLPLVLIATLAGGVAYVRLLYGPISLKVLAGPIARSIANELVDIRVAVEDATVALGPDHSLEFRLRNVRFSDHEGAPVALAPQASLEISAAALWAARIAPAKVVLIEPRVLVFHSPETGFSLTFARPAAEPTDDATRPKPVAEPAASAPDAEASIQLQRIDLVRMLAQATARARKRSAAASFLTDIGVRNATIIFDQGGRQTMWRVLEADVDLEHKKRRSTVDASMTVASAHGPWTMTARIEESEKEQTFVATSTVRDLVPRSIAKLLPQLAPLEAIEVPVAIDARFELTSSGELRDATAQVSLAPGRIVLPGAADLVTPIESGAFELRYDHAAARLDLVRGDLDWNGGRIAGTGTAVRTGGAGGAWSIDLKSTGGALAAPDLDNSQVRIDEARLQAVVDPVSGTQRGQATLRTGNARFSLAGSRGTDADAQPLRLDGHTSAMPLSTLKAVWPRWLAPRARAWVSEQVTRGQVQSTTFKMIGSPMAFSTGTASREQRLTMSLEASDLQIVPVPGMSPVDAPRALVRVEGSGLEVTIPDASVAPSPGRRIQLKGGRLTAVDILGDRPASELVFRAQGGLPAALDLVAQEPIALTKALAAPTDGIDGKVDGQFRLQMPLVANLTAGEVRTEAKVRLTDLRARHIFGTTDVQGGSINIDVTDKAAEAKGELLVAGVNAKLSWQRIFGASEDKQPPLRITATLDNSDRNQLGLDINHIVQGEMPVELTVVRGARNEPQVRVRADLTNADLVLQNLAWRKPPGRAATAQFDVGKGTRYKTELQNFKLVGDDVAVDGWLALDAQNKLREFLLPDFSINVISRLELQGVLRADNVWEVKARGPTYDGREFFRSLFSVGQLTERPLPARKEESGLDLKAEIDNVVGFAETPLKAVRIQLSKRQGQLTQLTARGALEGGRTLDASLQPTPNTPRTLIARSDDAGQTFKLVGFYPNLQNGRMKLEVNLDARGAVEKNGVLMVEAFQILGDPIISEVLQISDDGRQQSDSSRRGPRRQVVRQVFEFDWMRVPFLVGNQQFVLSDSELRGPLVGAVIRGKADFRQRFVSLGGTYVPLQGLNSAIGAIPGLGQLLAGPRGEGVLGITFAIQGPMAQPQVIVNPLSLIAPGIFREMFQMTNPTPYITPVQQKDERTKPAAEQRARARQHPETQRIVVPVAPVFRLVRAAVAPVERRAVEHDERAVGEQPAFEPEQPDPRRALQIVELAQHRRVSRQQRPRVHARGAQRFGQRLRHVAQAARLRHRRALGRYVQDANRWIAHAKKDPEASPGSDACIRKKGGMRMQGIDGC